MQATIQQGNWQKQWGRLVSEAWSDEDLKERLMADPSTVMREYGIDVPEGTELKVVEDTAEVRHLVLPASPSNELSDEELTCSVGFDSFSGFSGGCGGCGCGSRRCGCDANS